MISSVLSASVPSKSYRTARIGFARAIKIRKPGSEAGGTPPAEVLVPVRAKVVLHVVQRRVGVVRHFRVAQERDEGWHREVQVKLPVHPRDVPESRRRVPPHPNVRMRGEFQPPALGKLPV